MPILLPPEIEDALAERARRLGTTPELLAVKLLRDALSSPPHESETHESLYDSLKEYIGSVQGTERPASAKSGDLFTEYLVEKHKKGKL
jgi:hypothetical protein